MLLVIIDKLSISVWSMFESYTCVLFLQTKPVQTVPKINPVTQVSPVAKVTLVNKVPQVTQVTPVTPVTRTLRTRIATCPHTSTFFEDEDEDMTEIQPTFSGPIIKWVSSIWSKEVIMFTWTTIFHHE